VPTVQKMMKTGVAVLVVIAIVTLTLLWGRMSWYHYTTELFEKVYSAGSEQEHIVDFKEIGNLPEPVQRYFRLVLKDGAPIITHAFVLQSGGFRAKPETEEWSQMEAVQYFSTRPRAFVWHAGIKMMPGVSVNVCDTYIEGKGKMKGKLMSLFTVIDTQSASELDEGALQRYLAEAVWFPTALLPSEGVSWRAIDDHRAQATLTDTGVTASLEFTFNDIGEIVSVFTPKRYREVSGTYEATPWTGRYADYIDVESYRIPTKAEVEWQLKEQVYPYWKATLEQVRYD